MITCPNCGHSVLDSQRFCGSCGTDMQAAIAGSPRGSMVSEEPSSPYAYSQSPSTNYGFQPSSEPSSDRGRVIIAGIILVLALCCVFACGIFFGDSLPAILKMFGFGASSSPVPKTTPTPISLLPVLYYLIG